LPVIVLPYPRIGIPAEDAGIALDLDQKKSLWRENQQVNLVQAAIVSNKFEI
jgi:hypothetical protein